MKRLLLVLLLIALQPPAYASYDKVLPVARGGAGAAVAGTATLVAGTVTVANTAVASNTIIVLSGQNSSGTHGELTVSARTVGTDFTITSTSVLDTRSIGYMFVQP